MTSQVRLRRCEKGWRLVLDDGQSLPEPVPSKTGPAKARAAHAAQPATEREPDPMHEALHALLAHHNGARQLMRHLAYLERTLKISGGEGLNGLPVDVLKKGLAQLEEFVSDWSSPGLAQLRLQLTMDIADKEEAGDESDNVRSTFLSPQRLEVSEVSVSDFEADAQGFELPQH